MAGTLVIQKLMTDNSPGTDETAWQAASSNPVSGFAQFLQLQEDRRPIRWGFD
jgi:hypothetical protein